MENSAQREMNLPDPESLDVTQELSFQEMIDRYPTLSKELAMLPLCHTTTWGLYSKIGRQKKINGDKVCDVYHEKLIYFFYGKASYAKKENNVATITNEDPITLIFDFNDIPHLPHRLLPFDSGGFDRYEFKHGFTKEDFTYDKPEKTVLSKLVQICYENNQSYRQKTYSQNILEIFQEVCRPLKELVGMYEASKYGKKNYGDQAFTFEIQFKDCDIDYTPKMIILPFTYYNENTWPKMKAAFKEKGIVLDCYNDNESSSTGTDSYASMKKKVLSLLDQYYNN